MVHPLYPVAQRLRGQRINVHHASGRIYCGQLHQVAMHGIYVSECTPMYASSSEVTSKAELESDIDLVYSPLAYFGFGALTGLTVGALAGRYYW